MEKKQKLLMDYFSEDEMIKDITENDTYQKYDVTVKIYNDGSIKKDKFIRRFLPPFDIGKKILTKVGREFLKEIKDNKNHFFIGFDKENNTIEYYEEIYPTPKDGCVFKSISEKENGELSYFVYLIESPGLCCKYKSNDDFDRKELVSNIMSLKDKEGLKNLKKELKKRNINMEDYKYEPYLRFVHHFSLCNDRINFHSSIDAYLQSQKQ